MSKFQQERAILGGLERRVDFLFRDDSPNVISNQLQPTTFSAHSTCQGIRDLPSHVSIVLFLFFGIFLSGCTALPLAEIAIQQASIQLQSQRHSTPVAVEANESVSPPPDLTIASTNRLLVVGVDGNLFTIAPTGGERFYLTSDANSQRLYTQPTWSTTGERIAWGAISRSGGNTEGTLVTALANGTAQTTTPTLFPPFYLFWSPDDSKVAYLSNWLGNNGPTIALHVANILEAVTEDPTGETSVEVDPVGVGRPFYFSWAPTSEQMVAHIGNREVLLLSLAAQGLTAQEPKVIVEESANFAAPQWFSIAEAATIQIGDSTVESVDGGLLYVTQDENSAQLVLSDNQGENEQILTPLARQDFLSFSMNTSGRYIAFIETTQLVGFNSFGPLFLYDLANEAFEQISTDPAIAFFWSPDGAALYFLTVEPEGGQPWLQVNIWDGDRVHRFARFVPSPSFAREYLPFADQYMQSMNFWSPDSQAIVYVGQAEDGTAGVWVQPVQEGAEASLVVAGTFATWSPR